MSGAITSEHMAGRFSEADLKELEAVFEIKRRNPADVAVIRDATITRGQLVWWRGEYGPEHVLSDQHWDNIKEYPQLYSVTRPRIQYMD